MTLLTNTLLQILIIFLMIVGNLTFLDAYVERYGAGIPCGVNIVDVVHSKKYDQLRAKIRPFSTRNGTGLCF